MALTRLDNLISSKTGKYLYVSPDDFNASDELNNRGNSPIRPFKSIQRAFLEIARYSYLPGPDNDRFDQFTVMLMPGNHYIDNRPGLVGTTGIDAFAFNQAMNEWEDNSNLDISDPNNILYRFNNTEGGAILPRGSSLVGYDLRRTIVRPLYVPDPADRLEKRSAIFNVTGGCYFWQFTIKDGDLEPSSPLYDKNDGVGKVYYQNGYWDQLAIPNYSHHKLTVFEYADKEELGLYYQKVAKAFSQYQPTIDDPGEFSERIQETRIVGPLSDIRSIESIKCSDSSPAGTITVEVTTKVNHGYFKNQFVSIENNGLDDQLNGTFPVEDIDLVDGRKFTYKIPGTVAALGTSVSLVSGTVYTAQSGLSANAVVKAEVDSVESASPYVFNCSIRSTWGICGIWANGLKATGFKSMVIAQYTGVSLQKDDRAFIRYDEYSNTFNQASLTDAFATVPYHTKGDAYWKDDWRNFHVRASDDAFIQNVSIFAVGFADHFLMESGGDMSITNSNSNFGNTSLHAIGFKGFAFNQDKGGYITDIIPPKTIPETQGNTKKNAYYTIDVKASNDPNNHSKIYYGDDEAYDPGKRPAASIDGFRIGARSDEKLYVKLTPRSAGAGNIYNATLSPNGFKKFTATASILNPSSLTINNKDLDAADRIEENKNFIAHEAYGYITGKYPSLVIKSGITIEKCRRDIGYLIDAAVQDLRLGGNINTIQAAESYYVGNNLSYITGELNETLEGYNYARDLAIAAMRNFAYLRQGTSTTAASSIVNIGDTSGIVQGMVVADYDPSEFTDGKLNAGASRPNSPVIPDNTYVKRVIDATTIELGQKAVFTEKKLVSDRFGDAKDQILANKEFIAAEAYDRMVLDFPGFVTPTGNPQDCKDDIIDVIEAIAENTAFGGNAETYDAAYLYETGAHVAGEEDQTIRAFTYARDMCIQVMRNEDVFIFGTHGLTQSKDTTITYVAPELVKDRYGDARNLILANKELIAEEAVARMMIEFPNHQYGAGYTSADCVDDVRDLLEAVADNLAYGGNDKTWDAAYSYVKGAHVAGEESETAYAFDQAKEMASQVMRNQKVLSIGSHGLTQTYGNAQHTWAGGTATAAVQSGGGYNHTFVSATAGAISSGGNYAHTFVSAVANGITANTGTQYTVTGAAYNPASGDIVFTSANHGLSTGNTITIADNALTFTCDMDNNATQHVYPRPTDPASGQALSITNATPSTFTVNVGASPIVQFNVSAADYNPTTGLMTLTIGNHTLSGGTSVRIADNSLTFTCEMDGNTSNKTYPRSSDPSYQTSVNITNVTATTITLDVGASPIVNHDVTSASYDPIAGTMVLTIGNHSLTAGTSVKIADNALTFTCSQDGNATKHTYPRTSVEKATVTSADYNPNTGILELTVPNHGFSNGRQIKLADDSLTFTCAQDGNATNHTYPRASDPVSGKWLKVSNVTANTFQVQVLDSLPSTNVSAHTFVSASANGLSFKRDPFYDNAINITAVTPTTITLNVGIANSGFDTITYNLPQPVIDRNGDARNLIIANKALIAAEAYERMMAENPGYVHPTGYGPQDCIDDILDFVNEVSYNLAFGGNDRVWDMANLYVVGQHVVGEELQTTQAFEYARDLMVQAMRNETMLLIGSHGLTQTKDTTITVNASTPVDNKSADARNLILANTDFISEIALGRMLANFPTYSSPTGYTTDDCLDDIKDVVNVVAHNLAYGGNDRVWDAANFYATGGHASGSVNETIYAFTQARDIIIEVMRNEDVTVGGHTTLTQSKDLTITADSTPKCASQVATVNTLIQILTNTVQSPNLLYGITRTFSNAKCNDVKATLTTLTDIVTTAVNTPSSLANVARTLSVGSCEDARTTITTLFDIVKNAVLTPASLSNVLRTVSNGSCQNVASAITTLFQIVNNTIANTGYLQSVDRVESPLGLAFGPSVNANASTTNSYLYFTLTDGVYTSEYSPTTDDTITQHTSYPECADQASAIRQYFTNISTIIQTGLNSVPRVEPSQLTTELASRATVWTLRTGSGSNPHNLETGTPIRLVPRARYDSVTNSYVDVDKRKIRLPNGFNTNEEYYVIAPARKTKPEPYEGTSVFNGTDQTKIMLASSKENAAAGIYIHSAEVEAIDPDIEIDVYQFVLDDNFDLHQYSCILEANTNSQIRTDVPHIFDIPFADISGHQVFFRENEGGSVPLVGSNYAGDPSIADGNGRIRGDKFFWARYQTEKTFTIHATKADAIADINAITFQTGSYDFSVFADKRESPVRFDPSYLNPNTTPAIYGKWYMQVEDHSSNINDPQYEYSILTRLHENTYSDISGQDKTNDAWFERIKDERDKDDRIYRLRYVIPDYLQAVRDPINGFSIKIRKDETRKLLPQKLVLKPVSGAVTKARFFNPVQPNEVIGFTKADFISNSLNEESAYDPYKRDIVGTTQYAKSIETSNYVSMTIQSGRYFTDSQSGDELLELTVFDLGITNVGLLNETFTTVKITAPQGGSFVADKTQSNSTNRIDWYGNSSGYAFIHAALNVPNTSDWYLILKGISGKIDYSEFENTRFSQNATFADLLTDEDFGKSLYIKDLIRKEYPEYYYRQLGSKVYTVTPGDIITDDANVQFYVDSVTDTGELDDTFYIFDVEEIQRRIYGQQDGIYYLTAVRGNISPFPTGAGNQGNFRNFKFSQPISKLYPLNYKNDPLWFKQLDNTEVDVPATSSAADNYTHGLVRVNDFKGSLTREMVSDFTTQQALIQNTYTQVSSTIDNRLRAQKGNAASGSEDRKIPIAGDSTVMSDQRLYVELRRPSIARAGNHTFEYLGFGPGNYSTGLPARQEIVLTPTQDFYAQSKKQDGGLVFYTGLNSNGDLYIGNRKIDAITGEEEFLESAQLVDSDDDTEDIGNLVTTFDTPVTFNEYITINGGDAQDRMSTFNSPVTINVLGRVREYAFTVVSNVSPSDGDDATLDKTQQFLNQDTFGDIVIARNRVAASVFQFNPRGSNGAAQGYKIQNHVVANLGSNITPNQSALYSTGLGTAIDATQNVLYGNTVPLSGDMLLKGSEVGGSGSIGWIYANFFSIIPAANILHFTMDGSTVITITWGNNLNNEQVGVTSGSQIRISNFSDSGFNGLWQIIGNGFTPTASTCQIALIENRSNVANDNPRLWSDEVSLGNDVRLEFSNSSWKEFGVLGAETLRTDTENIGDYKLGINTVARSAHDAYKTAFTDVATAPRANLDVVGNTFISGKIISDYLDNAAFANRTETSTDYALLVGGDSATPANEATLRVATTNNGRVGINVTNAELDRALVVDGESRFTGDARFQQDIEVHGGGGTNTAEIRTDITSGTFNFLMNNTFIGVANANGLKIAGWVQNIEIGNETAQEQYIELGTKSLNSNIFIGSTPDTPVGNISKVEIGGAYNNNESQSYTEIKTKSLKVNGDFQLGTRRTITDSVRLSTTAGEVSFFSDSGSASTINFGLNASEVNIAGQGGKTTINNQLEVIASAKFNGDVHMCGGLASFAFSASRGQSGTTISAHDDGIIIADLQFNKNIDILNVLRLTSAEDGYNQIDTAGSGTWGSNSYQDDQSIGLPTLSGDEFYLPLKNKPDDADGNPYFKENDYIIVDSPVVTTTGYPEFLKVLELTRINTAPYYIKVERKPFGTFTGQVETHPDTTPIYKVNVQFDSTWTEQALDADGPEDNVYLAEFGGDLNPNDYVIVDREDTNNDGTFDQGEILKVLTSLNQQVQKFRISDCGTPDNDVFIVDSTTGDTYIGGKVTIENSVNINGGCSTTDRGTITGNITPATGSILVDTITNVSATDIAKVKLNDTVKFDGGGVNADLFGNTRIIEIGTDFIKLNQNIVSTAALTNVTFRVTKNEEFIITNGKEQNTLYFDTCSAALEIGNQIRRIDISRVLPGSQSPADTVSTYDGSEADQKVYSYWVDPATINANGPITTLTATANTGPISGSVYLNVAELGLGSGRFAEGDLVLVGNTSQINAKGTTGTDWEIMEVGAVDTTSNVLRCIPGQEGTTANALSTYPATTTSVVRILKHPMVSSMLDIEERTRDVNGTNVPYVSVIIDKGQIVQTKLDYTNFVRITNASDANGKFYLVNGGLLGKYHTPVMDETLQDGNVTHRNGDLVLNKDFSMYGGNIVMKDSVGKTNILRVVNDDGHADHSGSIYFDAGIIGRGNITLYPATCPENVVVDAQSCNPSFKIDTFGNGLVGQSWEIVGSPAEAPAKTPKLSVQNLGINGADRFVINQDNSIDAFGINNFYTTSGGRHARYVSTGSDADDKNLQSNVTYFVNVTNQDEMILFLPENAQSGDRIEIIEVGGNLTYDTSLVIRALGSQVRVQGDSSGTTIGLGGSTPYNSGELVVQTPNAAFTLIYLGSTDSQGTIVSSSVTGWWLKEV